LYSYFPGPGAHPGLVNGGLTEVPILTLVLLRGFGSKLPGPSAVTGLYASGTLFVAEKLFYLNSHLILLVLCFSCRLWDPGPGVVFYYGTLIVMA